MPVPPTLARPTHSITSIASLRAAGVKAGLKASGNMDLALLVSDVPLAAAAVFTQNKLAAAPVEVSRAHLAKSKGRVRALVVNSGNANSCTGPQGLRDAQAMCLQVARLLRCPLEQVLVCSTGVIGVPLPMEKISAGIAAASAALSTHPEAGRDFARAITTTDAYTKEADATSGGCLFAGVCKGAGMIEPEMATMLAFIATDARVRASQLRAAVPRIAQASFNAVHVDSHASTNDTFLVLSTGARPAPAKWEAHLQGVARRLAWLIARDGEGATKVTEISVRGARSDSAARAIARRVCHSALVRTALFGNDPNWGRFTSQVGNAKEVVNIAALTCTLQGVRVFERGAPTTFDRAALSTAMRREAVSLEFVLRDGKGKASIFTSDLGYRYVELNAEYTT